VQTVPARVIVEGGHVFLEKSCPAHGVERALLSRHPDYYRKLLDFYFDALPRSLPQRDYILRLTGRCNLQCPICLADANDFPEADFTLDDLTAFLRGRRKLKLDLMGAEPTLHPQLVEMIRLAERLGHITALHTNGLAIQDRAYLDGLLAAGLREVHLQCDGFDDEHDRVIRDRPMTAAKREALAALEARGVATDLVVTIVRGVNESAMRPMLDYAAQHEFVKEVFYLGCRRLGRATEAFAERSYAPDELIDVLEQQTGGRVRRADLLTFQKLYFSLLALLGVRKCFYIHHYLALRTRDGWRPVADFADLAYLAPRLDRFRALFRRWGRWAAPYLLFHGAVSVLKRGGFALAGEAARLLGLLALGFDLSRVRRRSILLGFITACDPWLHDVQVAANCGKGEASTDLGVREAGADANVERERRHRTASASSSR
jgi:molybdenum cofactor biosynthesis enzyme MoaA